jgi:hypothetical protein
VALLFCDGFDVQDFASKWTSVNGSPSIGSTTRYSQGSCIQYVWGEARGIALTIPTTATLHTGFAFMFTAISSVYSVPIMYLGADAGATIHLHLGVSGSTSKLDMRLGAFNGTVLGTATNALSTGTWYYIETMTTIADSGGRAVVKVNGVTEIDFTGDTKNGGTATSFDTIKMGNHFGDFGAIGTARLDDLYVLDSSGSVNNTYLGEQRVNALLPSAAGASTQFTPSTGSNNWDLVNDVPPSDSTYNSSSTSGHRDTYTLANPVVVGTIHGVQVVTRMVKSDAGAASAKAAIKSSSTVAYGTTRTLSASATTYRDIWETDPDTSSAWTGSGANALEAGAEVI